METNINFNAWKTIEGSVVQPMTYKISTSRFHHSEVPFLIRLEVSDSLCNVERISFEITMRDALSEAIYK